jgi:hypothetical protein
MKIIPKFHSNKKYWRIFNKLVFGEACLCPICNTKLKENYERRYLWCNKCRKKYRATAYKASWLYGLKISFRLLFILIWCWQNKQSFETTQLKTGLSCTTICRWFKRFREHIPPDTVEKLSGTVQIDESFFGKQKSQQPQLLVLGAIEGTGINTKIALKIIPNRNSKTLEDFTVDNVAPNTHIDTDFFSGYNDLSSLGYGYEHDSWNHSEGAFTATNHIEGLWSVIKRFIRKLYGCIPTKHLSEILNEYVARINRKEWFSSPEAYLKVALY